MDWKHKRRIATIPDPVRIAHEHSINHRLEVLASDVCGCFHCKATFQPSHIADWTDDMNGEGQTALCPKCGIDSVIGDRAGFELSADFLALMNRYWF